MCLWVASSMPTLGSCSAGAIAFGVERGLLSGMLRYRGAIASTARTTRDLIFVGEFCKLRSWLVRAARDESRGISDGKMDLRW